MPRDGSNVYSAPAGTTATSGTAIESAKYNAFVNDLVADANTPRPIVAGGTGATTAADARTNLGITAANVGAQPLDATLTALAAYNTNGLLTQTAADTFTGRTLTAGTGISVTNGDGVSGNPTVAVSGALSSIAGITFSAGDVLYATGASTLARLPIGSAGNVLTVSGGAPAWAAPASTSPHTLLGTITTTSGTSQTLSGLTLTGYTALLLVVNGVSFNSGGQLCLQTVGGVTASAGTAGAAGLLYGTVWIDLATGVVGTTAFASDSTVAARGGLSTISNASTSLTVATNAPGIAFDAGSVRVYRVL